MPYGRTKDEEEEVSPEWGLDLTAPAPPATGEMVPGEWGLDLTQPEPKASPIRGMPIEQAEAVYKFASERAKPQSAPVSDADKIRIALAEAEKQAGKDRGWAMLQRGAATIGGAFSGQKPDERFFSSLEEEADRPVLNEKAKLAAALAEAERIATGKRADREAGQRERQLTVNEGQLRRQAADDVADREQRSAEKAAIEERRARERAENLDRDREVERGRREDRALGRAMMERVAQIGAGQKAGERQDRTEMDLRKELAGAPATKQFQEVSVAFDKVQRAAADPSAAGDLSLIFSYMKLLDPGSSVREGEFANAQNATGVPEQVRNMFNRAMSGERLSPSQRQDFIKQARKQYDVHRSQYDQLGETYGALAQRRGIDPSSVVLKYGREPTKAQAGGPPPTQGGMPPGAVRKQVNKKTGQVRYFDASGNVIR